MEFERLYLANKIKIGKLLVSAHFNGDVVWIANYQKSDRAGGTPKYKEICMDDVLSVFDLEDNSLEDFTDNDFVNIALYIKEDAAPWHDCGGCNELRIQSKDEKDYYYIWCFDHRENRVYIDEIESYTSYFNKEFAEEKDFE